MQWKFELVWYEKSLMSATFETLSSEIRWVATLIFISVYPDFISLPIAAKLKVVIRDEFYFYEGKKEELEE